jgi:hypothetical protein
MKITPFVLAIRAVSAEFAHRVYIPAICIAGGIAAVLIIVLVWLVTVSGWWWLLLAPVLLLTIAGMVAALIAWFLIKLVRPQQTKEQRTLVRSLVDEVQKTSEVVQTPKIIILFRLVKDIALPTKKSFIGDISTTASSLKTGLRSVVTSFKK